MHNIDDNMFDDDSIIIHVHSSEKMRKKVRKNKILYVEQKNDERIELNNKLFMECQAFLLLLYEHVGTAKMLLKC